MVTYEDLEYRSDHRYYHQGAPFTGIASDSNVDGSYEQPYVDGVSDGIAKSWYPNGKLREVCHSKRGAFHGAVEEYDESGRLLKRARYELGVKIEEETYGPDGGVIDYYILTEKDPNWTVLLSMRNLL